MKVCGGTQVCHYLYLAANLHICDLPSLFQALADFNSWGPHMSSGAHVLCGPLAREIEQQHWRGPRTDPIFCGIPYTSIWAHTCKMRLPGVHLDGPKPAKAQFFMLLHMGLLLLGARLYCGDTVTPSHVLQTHTPKPGKVSHPQMSPANSSTSTIIV